MKFCRLYAGSDGQSHFESLDSGAQSEFFNATRKRFRAAYHKLPQGAAPPLGHHAFR